MPNLKERREPEDDLEVAARVMQTVERQISEYRTALEKVRLIRKEFELDPGLSKRAFTDPEAMKDLLVERGVAEPLAYGMAAEDFKAADFGGRLSLWTWDCCCTECCFTSCNCTLITSITGSGGGTVIASRPPGKA